MEKLIEIVNLILQNKGQETVTGLEKNVSLRTDLGFDSFDLAELTVRIENEFDIDIFEDGVVDTVEEVLMKLK